MGDLDGKIALVTGAGRGIGRASAGVLHAAGAHIIAVARTAGDIEALAGELHSRCEAWSDDVTTDAFIARIEALPRLDILVNNAGANRPQPVCEVSDENLDFLIDLNVRSVFRAARAAARVMVRGGQGGSIISLSSQMGHVGSPNRSVYCMTKHAVEGMTKAMAVELAPHNIRVNTVAPTFITTPMTKPMLDDPAFKAFVDRMIPLGRIGDVQDVAAAIRYLASPSATMITGHSLVIDGGWTAQ